MQAAGYKSSPQNHSGWHQAPDGRRFRVYEGRCVHYDCWQARCGCGHKLTAHDFDADGAYRSALEALSRRDPLDRPDFAHPPEQCHPAPRSRNA